MDIVDVGHIFLEACQTELVLTLFADDALDGLLLFLQCAHHLLLLLLLAFQALLFLDAAIEQVVLLAFGLGQFLFGLGHVLLHHLDSLALYALIAGIFAHEAHAAVHLCEVLGAEDEHEAVLYGTVAVHVAQ